MVGNAQEMLPSRKNFSNPSAVSRAPNGPKSGFSSDSQTYAMAANVLMTGTKKDTLKNSVPRMPRALISSATSSEDAIDTGRYSTRK